MANYQWKPTNLIAEELEACGLVFEVREHEGAKANASIILIPFVVTGGGRVDVHFISSDDSNNVAVRVYQLISQISEEKRSRMLEACNRVMNRKRYLKFVIDDDGDLDVHYDIPQMVSDEVLPKIAVEMFVRMKRILNDEYSYLMKALYSDAPLD